MRRVVAGASARARGGRLPAAPPPIAPPPGETQSFTYTEDVSTNFLNPERGLYPGDAWHGTFGNFRGNGYSVGRYIVRLDDFRSSPLSAQFLTDHANVLASARAAGIKVEVRCAYNYDWVNPDAPLSRILGHIDQLAPVWADYQDVIMLWHAGFIGAWGEWHSSQQAEFQGSDPTGRNAVIAKLIDNVPTTRMIALRNVEAHTQYFGNMNPLPTNDRFTGTPAARLGVLNDGFMSNVTDSGTFIADPYTPDYTFSQAKYDYWAQRSPLTVGTGETLNPGWSEGNRYAGADSIAEMAALGWDVLNRDYWAAVFTGGTSASGEWFQGWTASGHLPEITRRLGYRLVLQQATVLTSVAAGASMSVTLNITNVGFGKVYNPRPIDLVFVGAGGPFTARMTADARRDLPLGGASASPTFTFNAPAGLQSGQAYALHLRLPDPHASIAADNRYAIRLANTGIWDANAGRHALGMSVTAT